MPNLLGGSHRQRVARVMQPVAMRSIHQTARTFVELLRQRHHRDAVLYRADDSAEIAADAFLLDHLEVSTAVLTVGDRLVGRVLAGDVAATAGNAARLINARFDRVVEVQVLPLGYGWDRAPHKIGNAGVAFLVHPG